MSVNRPSGFSPRRCDRRWTMVLRDPVGIAYAAIAIVCAFIAVVT